MNRKMLPVTGRLTQARVKAEGESDDELADISTPDNPMKYTSSEGYEYTRYNVFAIKVVFISCDIACIQLTLSLGQIICYKTTISHYIITHFY